MSFGSTLIGAAAGLFGGLAGAQYQKDLQVDAAKELIDYQNDYNDPSKMIKRYKNAGVSPAALFSQGVQPMPSADSSGVNVDTSFGTQLVNAASSFARTQAENSLIDAQRKNIEADTEVKIANADLSRQQMINFKIQNEFLPKILNLDLFGKDLDNQLKELTKGLTTQQTNYYKEMANKVSYEAKNLEQRLTLYVEEIRKAKNEADIQEMRAKATPDFIMKELANLQGDLVVKQQTAAQLSALIQSINADTDIKKTQKQLNDISLRYADEVGKANKEKSQREAKTALYVELQQENQLARQQAGEVVAETLAPVAEVTGAIGNIFSGIVKMSVK